MIKLSLMLAIAVSCMIKIIVEINLNDLRFMKHSCPK